MTSNATSDADATVRSVLDDIYTAWGHNDADAFVAPYAETATAILPGAYLPDREAIRATMASLFSGQLAGSTGVHEVQSIRFIGADTAIVISKGAMKLADQTAPDPASRALDTWVLARSAESWLVHAFASSPETAAG